jgi:hypothetical protein
MFSFRARSATHIKLRALERVDLRLERSSSRQVSGQAPLCSLLGQVRVEIHRFPTRLFISHSGCCKLKAEERSCFYAAAWIFWSLPGTSVLLSRVSHRRPPRSPTLHSPTQAITSVQNEGSSLETCFSTTRPGAGDTMVSVLLLNQFFS